MTATPTTAGSPRWFHAEDCNIEDFAAVVSATTSLEDYPFADTVEQNVLIYGPRLHSAVDSREDLSEIQAELARALTEGPGIVVFKGAFPDPAVVDRTTQAFNRLIEAQKAAGSTGGTTSPSPGPTTGSGGRWTSWPWPSRRSLPNTTAPRYWHWSPRPGSAPTIR